MTWAISHVWANPFPPGHLDLHCISALKIAEKSMIDQTNKHAEQQKRTNIDQQNVLTCTNMY